MSDVEVAEMFVRDTISVTSGMCRWKLTSKVDMIFFNMIF